MTTEVDMLGTEGIPLTREGKDIVRWADKDMELVLRITNTGGEKPQGMASSTTAVINQVT
jgi:hypothetical protein